MEVSTAGPRIIIAASREINTLMGEGERY